MTRSDYINDQVERRWPEQFKDHVARFAEMPHPEFKHPPISWLRWSKPGTSVYACRYIIQSCWLFVGGDLFEATYQWGDQISWDFLDSINLDYFLGKCRASPTGREFRTWDSDVAWSRFNEMKNGDEYPLPDELFITEASGAEDYEFLAHEVFNRSGDAEAAADIRACGVVPNTMAIGHFVGIKMAVAQMKAGAL